MATTNCDYDVIVIGGGALGLATSYKLAQKAPSTKVLVLERFTFLNQLGSSAGKSRQFRIPYPEAYMVQMAEDARPYWDELQTHSDKLLMSKVGTLWFGDPTVKTTEGNIRAAKLALHENHVPYTPLTKDQIEQDYGFKNLPDNYEGLFQSDGASINLPQTLQTLLSLNQGFPNVTLTENADVTGISQVEDIFTVNVGTESFRSLKIVVVPGPYINDILKLLNFQVPVTYWQMTSCYFKKQNPDTQYPTWFAFQQPDGDNGNEFYGFPEEDWDVPGHIRVAPDFVMKPLSNPDDADYKPNLQELEYTSQWVQNNMTGLDATPSHISTCMIALSNEPNKEILLDFAPSVVPNANNIVICATGWAAKFIPLIGHILADMVLEGTPNYDISHFTIDDYSLIPSKKSVSDDPKGNVTHHDTIDYDRDITLNTGMQEGLKLQTAIVGAGMSGLYSAYRLTVDNGVAADQVQIFDMSKRIAGRIESVKMPDMNVVGELGGMRYLTSQKIVTTLIEQVFSDNLEHEDFPMGDPTKLLMYLRKQRLKQSDWETAQKEGQQLTTNYILNADNVGFNADQLFNKIFYDVLMADRWFSDDFNINADGSLKVTAGPTQYDYTFQLTSEDWDTVKLHLNYCFPDSPYHGRKVYELGFWNLIKDQVSQEGYTFLANAGGYYSNTINWNAAEAFPYMLGDFSEDTTYKTIKTGYDSLAYELAKAYLNQDGANIWTENKLVTFTKDHDCSDTHRYMLTFLNLQTGTNWNIYANKIILAMPRRSLQLLDQSNFFFNEQQLLNENIRSVIMEPAYKILMGFKYPWWHQLDIKSGHSITDLPMRQCYYFGTDPENQHSMLLGSYGDMSSETFWKALSDDKRLFQVRFDEYGFSPNKLQNIAQVQATELMVKEVMNELRELHGPDVTIPDPYVTWFRDWTDDPFGGGYHAWKAGYKVNEVMPYMRQPMPEENIHICGEAYSDLQGWVEGAFCEAEKMLEEHFGLAYPSWLDPNYYLGW